MAPVPTRIAIPLLPKQKEFLRGPKAAAKVAAFVGGLGSGKTHGGGIFTHSEAIRYPRNYICVAAATYPQLQRSTIRIFRALFDSLKAPYVWHQQRRAITFPHNGSEIIFVSCDVPPTQLQGPEFGALCIDEGEGVSEEHFKTLRARVRLANRDGGGWDYSRRVRVIANPPHMHHWITRHFYSKPIPGYQLVQASTHDNHLLTADYLAELHHLYPVGTPEHRRWILGEMGVPVEGAIYPEFASDRHTISEDEWSAIAARQGYVIGYFCGLDLGADHPTCFLQLALGADDCLYVVGEHHARFLPIDEHLEHIAAIYRGGPIFADHELQTRLEYEFRGWPTVPAPKHLGWDLGCAAVRRRLVLGQLKVVRDRCPKVIEEFAKYRHARPARPDTPYKDGPVKVDDDAMDALRYGVTGLDLALAEGDDSLTEVFAQEIH